MVVSSWGAISLAVIFALVWQWLNWSGARRLAAAKAQLEAADETLDVRELFPEAVPAELNFCATPALKDLALLLDEGRSDDETDRKRERLKSLALPEERAGMKPPKSSTVGKPLDAEAWLKWLGLEFAEGQSAPEQLLKALSRDFELEAELAAALDRPHAQWTPAWADKKLPDLFFGMQYPHYQYLRPLVSYYALRAAAAAQAGNAVFAHQCARVLLRFGEASSQDPFLIGMVMSQNHLSQARRATWEICRVQAGSAEDFALLEGELGRWSFKEQLLAAYRSEMCAGVQAVEWAKLNGLQHLSGSSREASSAWHWSSLVPGGWVDANAASIIERYQEQVIGPLLHAASDFQLRHTRLEELIKGMSRLPWSDDMFARLIFPSVLAFENDILRGQCQQQMAVIACALEAHALRHGIYPATLDDLASINASASPSNPFNGEPCRYERTANGRYRLCFLVPEDKGGSDEEMVWEYP